MGSIQGGLVSCNQTTNQSTQGGPTMPAPTFVLLLLCNNSNEKVGTGETTFRLGAANIQRRGSVYRQCGGEE